MTRVSTIRSVGSGPAGTGAVAGDGFGAAGTAAAAGARFFVDRRRGAGSGCAT
jgi:hypothetical protein